MREGRILRSHGMSTHTEREQQPRRQPTTTTRGKEGRMRQIWESWMESKGSSWSRERDHHRCERGVTRCRAVSPHQSEDFERQHRIIQEKGHTVSRQPGELCYVYKIGGNRESWLGPYGTRSNLVSWCCDWSTLRRSRKVADEGDCWEHERK